MPDIMVSLTLNSLLPWRTLYLPAPSHENRKDVVALRPPPLRPVGLGREQQVQEGWCSLTGHTVRSYEFYFHRKIC